MISCSGADEDGNHQETDRSDLKKEQALDKRERIYATIEEVMGDGYVPGKAPLIASSSVISETSESMKTPIFRSSSAKAESNSAVCDLNANLTPSRKRNSNTDSGISIQTDITESETNVTEDCSPKEERKKIAKVHSTKNSEMKKTEKENK